MIGKLNGLIDIIREDRLILDVNGVGYVVFCSASTLQQCPASGEACSLYIETHVREDHIHLFGFVSESEQKWFLKLTTVKGVGPRMALAILSSLNPAQLEAALMSQDKKAFTRAQGVGGKLAERIVTELKGQFVAAEDVAVATLGNAAETIEAGAIAAKPAQDALSALVNLGYGRSDAYLHVQRVLAANQDASMEEIIRQCLKELAA